MCSVELFQHICDASSTAMLLDRSRHLWLCGHVVLVVGPLSVMNRSIPTQQPWVALGSPATQEFYALVR